MRTKKKKPYIEIFLGILFVLVGTFFVYRELSSFTLFWESQTFWSIILIIGWIVVSIGYFHQGWLVHKKGHSDDVSIVLPIVVFLVQCVLFVKGAYYNDWALIGGALLVNSGVTFSFYQIVKQRLSMG